MLSIFNTSKKNNKPVKIHKTHNLSSAVVYQVVIFSRLQWKEELLFMLEAVGFEQSGSRDPWESQARVGVRVKDSKVLRQPLMDASRDISSSCSQL